jgi:hypothetical protein
VWGLACPWRLLKPLCLGPACDPARRVGSRVRERKHTDSLCWVGTKGRGALFGSPWRGPRICGQAHTGSGQASRVARRHARSCKRSVLGPVDDKRAPGVELLDRRPTAASGRAALPATAFFWFLGDRFLVSVSLSFGSGGWRLEGGSAEARKRGSAVVENRKAAMDSKQCTRENRENSQRLWFQAGASAVGRCKMLDAVLRRGCVCWSWGRKARNCRPGTVR